MLEHTPGNQGLLARQADKEVTFVAGQEESKFQEHNQVYRQVGKETLLRFEAIEVYREP